MAEHHRCIAELWTHRQTARFLRITPGTLYVWLSKGIGPRSFKIGGSRRYDPSDVQEFLRQRLDSAPTAESGDGGRIAAAVHLPSVPSGNARPLGVANAATIPREAA